MKLEVEYWINKQSFSKDVVTLFNESIICYKAGAYRSSFLTSYLAFLQIVKDRVIEGEKPFDIEQSQWDARLKKINNEDLWEQEINTILSQKNRESGKNNFFLISDNLMEDIKYFKRRRNDCAHAKTTMINNSHVESLWIFLYNHLSKVVLNGGKEALLIEIDKFFDYTYTKVDKSYDYLIEKIDQTVEKDEYQSFFDELKKITDFTEDETFEKHNGETERKRNFWRDMFFKGSERVREGIINYISKNETNFTFYIIQNPSILEYFKKDDSLIRKIWTDTLYNILRSSFSTIDYWPLISHLIRNNFIAGVQEIDLLLERISEIICVDFEKLPYDDHLELLNKLNFSQKIKPYILKILSSSYVDINKKTNVIMFYIYNYGLDLDLSVHLNKLFQKGYEYGTFKNALDGVIERDPAFLFDLKAYLSSNDIDIDVFFEK